MADLSIRHWVNTMVGRFLAPARTRSTAQAAYDNGFQASLDGQGDNPYPSDTFDHAEWLRGHEDGEQSRSW